jgi:DNA helicase-2/ATP-dependent DNA helicase PcrA
MVNESDDVSFRRVVNVPPRKIGPKALEVLEAQARIRNESLMKTLGTMIAAKEAGVGPSLAAFHALMLDLRQRLESMPLSKMVETLVHTLKYLDHLQKKFPDQALDKTENVWEIAVAMDDFERREGEQTSLRSWLQSVTLNTGDEVTTGGVSMMTLHMAKGLEFKRVYLVGLEEGLLPHRSSLESRDQIEEERRLLYVGMTRARERLTLSTAYRRRTYTEWLTNAPSRFLKEIPQKHMATDGLHAMSWGQDSSRGSRPQAETGDSWVRYDYSDPEAAPSKPAAKVLHLRIGLSVLHPSYGRGVIESLDLEHGQMIAIVSFEDFGRRRVMGRGLTPSVVG